MSVNVRNITAGTAGMLKVLALGLAVVFVVSLAMAASAQAFSITGKVVSIDPHKKTLTVAAYIGPDYPLSYSGGADRINTFALKRGAMVMKGDRIMDFRDIRVGNWVTVNYYEEGGGLPLAGGIAITTPPAAYQGETVGMFSLPGKVVAIDREARTLTVDPSYYYGSTSSVRVFALDRGTVIMMGDERRDFDDIRAGDWVTVNFRQEGNGLVVAEGIAITAPPAPSAEGTARSFSIPGKVVAVDRVARTLTLDPSYCYGSSNGGRDLRVFALDRGTVIMMGDKPRDFDDIRAGDWVTVNFHQGSNGLVIADGVAFTSPAVIACPENRG